MRSLRIAMSLEVCKELDFDGYRPSLAVNLGATVMRNVSNTVGGGGFCTKQFGSTCLLG